MSKTSQIIDNTDNPEVIPIPVGRTRYGRKLKKPARYEPVEKVEDDFSGSDDGDDLPQIECISMESDAESSDDESDSDADENGNLKEFVTYSDEEEEILEHQSEEEEEDEEEYTDSDYSDSE